MSNAKLWLVGLFCAAAGPYIVATIYGYWALLMTPAIQAVGAKAQPNIFAAITLFNMVGALLAAAVLSVPLGLVARSKPWVLGLLVGLVVAAAMELMVYPIERPGFHLAMHVIESVSFVGGCALMTSLISRFLVQRSNPSLQRIDAHSRVNR
ncbi:MAG: hypothetical protein ING36_15635 [Burkholderiales bacterium]|jgi:hypothetical protein|nr:hypothetical protein [Burkholderiales bacterium]